MTFLRSHNVVWILHGLVLPGSFGLCLAVNTFHLCFPTMTRHLAEDELYMFEKLTDHYLRTEGVSDPDTYLMSQSFVPYGPIKRSESSSSDGTWYTIEDTAAGATSFRDDACMTVTIQVSCAHDGDPADALSRIWSNETGDAVYVNLLRLGMIPDLWIPLQDSPPSATTITTTTTSETDDQITTTTTTTTTTTRTATAASLNDGTWVWTIAIVLLVGSLTVVAIWYIYLRPSPLRYIRKNESRDGTTDPNNWPDHGSDSEMESAADAESSRISFCTSS